VTEGAAAPVTTPFADRAEAGRVLADHVAREPGLVAPVVVALPRGGVPVGAEVARRLGAPLVVMPVCKVGAPGQEELAVGAVAPGGVTVLNQTVVASLGLGAQELDRLVAKAAARVAEQLHHYGGGPPASLWGRSAIVVDDGLATGATMRAALVAVRRLQPGHMVLAVPVAPPSVLLALAPLADAQICPVRPSRMQAVGSWYLDFTQITDAEVADLLGQLGPG
jgi:putative phosphoribosyl transferase